MVFRRVLYNIKLKLLKRQNGHRIIDKSINKKEEIASDSSNNEDFVSGIQEATSRLINNDQECLKDANLQGGERAKIPQLMMYL